MKPQDTLFIHGLWFNPNGSLAKKLGKHVTIFDLLGIDTIEDRVRILVEFLKDYPQFTRLIGHSAGCYVIAKAIKSGLLGGNIQEIVLLNPAPMPGIKFSPFDAVFWALSKPVYLWKLFTGQDIELSRGDTKRLLSLSDKDLEELGEDSLVAESGKFTRHIVLNQFRRLWSCVHPRKETKLFVVSATDDQMVGSTWVKTEKVFSPTRIHRITGGHMAVFGFFVDTITEAVHGPLS